MVNELVRWDVDGASVIVETDETVGEWAPASSLGNRVVHDAKERFEDALIHVRDAAQVALRTFRECSDEARKPDEVEVEFGVKLGAEAAAIIAKTSLEGQFTVRLKWVSSAQYFQEGDGG
jgi:Trypsin-co-occurring domain 1